MKAKTDPSGATTSPVSNREEREEEAGLDPSPTTVSSSSHAMPSPRAGPGRAGSLDPLPRYPLSSPLFKFPMPPPGTRPTPSPARPGPASSRPHTCTGSNPRCCCCARPTATPIAGHPREWGPRPSRTYYCDRSSENNVTSGLREEKREQRDLLLPRKDDEFLYHPLPHCSVRLSAVRRGVLITP